MYELMVCFGNGGYMYYNTDQILIDKATREWGHVIDHAGMNIDNMNPTSACLRDNNGNIIAETTNVMW